MTQERGHLRELYEGVPTEAGPSADQPATGQEAAPGEVAEESKEIEATLQDRYVVDNRHTKFHYF